MKKELSYLVVEYNQCDIKYLDYICNKIQNISKEIVDFFEIKTIKINVKLFDKIELFQNTAKNNAPHLLINNEIPLWLCGISIENNIYTLSLKELKKTSSYKNVTSDDLACLILHEFTHSCVHTIVNGTYNWLGEGIASTLSHQFDNKKGVFNASLDQMIDGITNYFNYYLMFSYVLKTYGKDYILQLLKDKTLLKNDTPKLYEELKKYYNK